MLSANISGFIDITVNQFTKGSIIVDASLFFDRKLSLDFVLNSINGSNRTLSSFKNAYLKSNFNKQKYYNNYLFEYII